MINTSNHVDTVLEVKNLKAGFGDHIVLDQISFAVATREIRVILGTSGCGKTTLLNAILGLMRVKEGSVSFFGEGEQKANAPILQTFRERCGVLFQNGALLSSMTLADNVALPLRTYRPELPLVVIEEMVAQKLESVSMLEAWHKYPAELSGGMRKRAALARALIMDPGLLFCDEPSAGLDPVTSRALDELLLKLRDQFGIAIVVVTHELESIKTIADKLLFLSAGNVLFDGDLQQGLASKEPELVSFFSRKAIIEETQRTRVQFKIKEVENGNHQG